jgi:hypothetical protein
LAAGHGLITISRDTSTLLHTRSCISRDRGHHPTAASCELGWSGLFSPRERSPMGYISGALPRKSVEAKQHAAPALFPGKPAEGHRAIGLDAFLAHADEVIPHREGELNKK